MAQYRALNSADSRGLSPDRAFTLLEALVVVAIISMIASAMLVSLNTVRKRGRDAKRTIDVSQIGRMLSASCYLPDHGPGQYDLLALVPELSAKHPQFARYAARIPKDPAGTDTESKYVYAVDANGKCAVFANLEFAGEPVTLPALSAPTPGGGTGVVRATSDGWNGTPKYFQVSN